MLNKPGKPAFPRGHRKKTAGIILFWIGFVGIIISSGMTVLGSRVGDNPDAWGIFFAGIIAIIVTLFMAILGAILYAAGKSQEIEQRNLNEADDPQSDYNNVD